jgi:hypothetical protein
VRLLGALHAAVAFMFLYDKGIFPIDYMSGTNVDHAFVVIGRKAGSDEGDPKTSGDSAVVCDPCNGNYFPASQFRDKMHKGKIMIPQSDVRANSPTSVM